MQPEQRKRPTDRTLESWESWVDEAIQAARDRGDFDNVRGTGEPLHLERNPFAGDREASFHVLKNADLAPLWMELDKELNQSLTSLEAFRRQAVAQIERMRDHAHEFNSRTPTERPSGRTAGIIEWLRGPRRGSATVEPAFDLSSVERERQTSKRQYLERAAAVDKRIVEYNAALPDEIRWLERPRLVPEVVAELFDAACPPVDGDASNDA
ncbi:MAG: DUF1992 domain-containing protein [Chloroflexota bacterium]|nr:DUF1992 domain-containing protein [Chloroflexota bacterium]